MNTEHGERTMDNMKVSCNCGNVILVPKDNLDAPFECPQCGAKIRPSDTPDNANFFICPNPKCDFKGTIYPARQLFWVPAATIVIILIILANVSPLSSSNSGGFDALFILIALVIFQVTIIILITQIVLRVMGRRYCPDCGIKLR